MKRKYMIIVLMAGALELTGCSQGTSNSAKNGTTGSENTIISESDIAILDTEDMLKVNVLRSVFRMKKQNATVTE